MKKKIAFIVQRYGLDVNGGAEYHSRVIAEKLNDIYEIEILTSCAKNHVTWGNEYPEGIQYVNNVKVNRFAVNSERETKNTKILVKKFKKRRLHQIFLRFVGLLDFYEKKIPAEITVDDFDKWSQYQGPFLPKLVAYLREHHQQYDALIFFTYLYYPTTQGIAIAPEKSILVPTAHDESAIYFPFFKKIFSAPKAILYNTQSEKRFVNKLFENDLIYSEIAAVGIDCPATITPYTPQDLLKTSSDYLIYIGRIDAAKGCKIMFKYFLQYKKTAFKDIKLVLIGQPFMPVPAHRDIISLGFVAEDIKNELLKNALALVMPSFYESLSLVTLESMCYGIPVIANEKCEVLRDHIESSKAGFLFNDAADFKTAIDTILNPATDLKELSKNARKYIAENYTWETTIEKYKKAIDFISPH